MFKNRQIRLNVVKTDPATGNPVEHSSVFSKLDFDKIDQILAERAKKLAVGFVAIYAAVRVIDASCEIAVNASPKKH